MSSEFRTAILHTAVGMPKDFRPRAPFVPEVYLYKNSGPSVFADLLLPVSQWGGWPAVLQELLQESKKKQTHLVGGILFNSLATDPRERCLGFLTSIKRLLITTRKNLLARGVEEIRTGTLVVVRDCVDWYDPNAGSGALTYLDRLEALGYSRYLCIMDARNESEVPPPFRAIPHPGPTTPEAQEWAYRLVEEDLFPDSA